MDFEKETARLSQNKAVELFTRENQHLDSLIVYGVSAGESRSRVFTNSALVGPDDAEYLFSQPALPFLESMGRFTGHWELKAIPFVIPREFGGVRNEYLELSECFRLYHNLFQAHDDQFIKIWDDGDEERVAQLDQEAETAWVRTREIREFLHAQEMHLAIHTEVLEFSRCTLDELGFEEGIEEGRNQFCRWQKEICDFDFRADRYRRRAMTRLRVLRRVDPQQPADGEPEKFASFIIGVDPSGNDLEHTCDPDEFSHNDGDNPEGFLTPVSFRKDVLDKYRSQPSKFRVDGGYLQCGYLWGLRMDDNHDDKVVVWLGDLEKLPYREQLHWRSYNFASESGVSETFFRSQLMAEPVESDRAEHRFREKYNELSTVGRQNLGWDALLTLDEAERYLLQDIRVSSNDEQRDFDHLILVLAKTLIDSVNVKGFRRFLSDDQRESPRSTIDVLEAATYGRGLEEASDHIRFLRNVQDLRSSGSAHRKGRNYRKIARRFGIQDRDDLRAVSEGILKQSVSFLEFLVELTNDDRFKRMSLQRTRGVDDILNGEA